MTPPLLRFAALIVTALLVTVPAASAQEIGQIKRVKGEVTLERGGKVIDAEQGQAIERQDILRTGDGSAVGMTFTDNSRMALGPNSELALETYRFAGQGDAGNSFDTRLTRGSMSAASGLIAKTPNA
ncbi:MAG: hypothetical protein AAF568_07930, partial [Pseudomonadota bacterium]